MDWNNNNKLWEQENKLYKQVKHRIDGFGHVNHHSDQISDQSW